jgi:hypothetical protein
MYDRFVHFNILATGSLEILLHNPKAIENSYIFFLEASR